MIDGRLKHQEKKAPRVLMVAYACEPGKGSEAGTGWNLALGLARRVDLMVLTRANNREKIEAFLDQFDGGAPEFGFVDPPAWVIRLKKAGLISVQLFYFFWQMQVEAFIKKRGEEFQIIHQLTFNTFEVAPKIFSAVGPALVWGPIGGGQVAPGSLLSKMSLIGRLKEVLRSFRIWVSSRNPRVRRALSRCGFVFFANRETERLLSPFVGGNSRLMIDVGVSISKFGPASELTEKQGILFAGAIEPRKGLGFLLEAFALVVPAIPTLQLRVVGDGPDLASEKERAKRLGIAGSVEFLGRLQHDEMAAEIQRAAVFAFPSLRDTSGAVVLEAMSCEVPVVALDHHGSSLMLADDAGVLVPVSDADGTVQDFASALQRLVVGRDDARGTGRKGRMRVAENFDWEVKVAFVEAAYRELLESR